MVLRVFLLISLLPLFVNSQTWGLGVKSGIYVADVFEIPLEAHHYYEIGSGAYWSKCFLELSIHSSGYARTSAFSFASAKSSLTLLEGKFKAGYQFQNNPFKPFFALSYSKQIWVFDRRDLIDGSTLIFKDHRHNRLFFHFGYMPKISNNLSLGMDFFYGPAYVEEKYSRPNAHEYFEWNGGFAVSLNYFFNK